MMRAWYASTFRALGNRQFRLLWIGTSISGLAYTMQWTVQAVVAFDLAGTNTAVGLVQLGIGMAMLILSPIGGVVADRVAKKPLVLCCQSIIGCCFLAIGTLILTGHLTLTWLVLITAFMGMAFAFLGPTQQAWVGSLVPQNMLGNAVALSQLASNGSRVAGPLVAGLMLTTAAIGAGGAYLFMGALFVAVVFTLTRLPKTYAKPSSERRAVATELMEGVRYVSGHSRIRTLMLLFMSVVVLGSTWQIVLPAYLERHLQRPPSDVGFILTVNAVSGLVTALALTAVVSTRWAWPAMFGCVGLLGLGFVLLAMAPSFEVALWATLALGPGLSGFMLVNNALIMANTDPRYFGRVMSLTMLAWGLQGAFSLPFGALADAFGERAMLFTTGGFLFVIMLGGGLAVLRLARNGKLVGRIEPASGPI